MEKIVVQNVGPIKECEFRIKPINIFIGPQATGKSTLVKLIYFFKSIEKELLELFKNAANIDTGLPDKNWWYKPLLVLLRKKFIGMFGVTKAMEDFKVRYFYNRDVWIEISLDKRKYLLVKYSPTLRQKLYEWAISSVEFFRKLRNNRKEIFLQESEIFELDQNVKFFEKELKDSFDEVFGKLEYPIFVPAGRALPSLLSEELNLLLPMLKVESRPEPVDILIRTFIATISLLKQKFSKPIDEVILDRKKLTTEKIDFKNIGKIKDIIGNVLKGNYVYEDGREKLYLSEDKWIYLKFSSSGQQEALWILIIIFSLILENRKTFLIAEEPEAHLFPNAQKEMVKAFALLYNSTNSGLAITTHSPYILTSLNNFLYAYTVASKTRKREEVNKIIGREFWLKPEDLNAFYVDNGTIIDIIDRDFGIIKAEMIDKLSEEINSEFNKLLDIGVSQ